MASHHPTLDTNFSMPDSMFLNIFIKILNYTTKAISKQSTDYAALCSISFLMILNIILTYLGWDKMAAIS